MSENNIEKIASFTINHELLEPGFYISRIDGDIITYDLRTRKPNAGDYMDNSTMHSVEHMVATLVRNSEIKDDVVYFGPMGCQTGFYLLVKGHKPVDVLAVVISVIKEALAYEGEIFGNSAVECGNYRTLSLEAAKIELKKYLEVLEKVEEKDFVYKQ